MTYDTPIITQLCETINRAENMVPFMRQDMIQLLEGAKCEIETLAANLRQMQEERDEARREVCKLENLDWIGSVCRKGEKETAIERGWDCFEETTP